MPLTATVLPAEIDAFGVCFTMRDRTGPVRCHVFRSTIDHLEDSHARTDAEALMRFEKERRRFERLASNLHAGGHQTPWITVHDMLTGMEPNEYDDGPWSS